MSRAAYLILLLTPDVAFAQEPIAQKNFAGWVGALAFAPEGHSLAVGTSSSLTVWNPDKNETLVERHNFSSALATLAYSRDGRQLACGFHDGIALNIQVSRDGKIEDADLAPQESGAVLATAFSSDGGLLFIGGMHPVIRAWDVKARKTLKLLEGHTSWVNGLALSPDGALLASASSDNIVRLWRTKDFEPIQTFRVKDGEVRCVAFSPDGKLVAAGIRYGGLRVWEVESKREVASLKAHEGETWAVAFTPDGKALASGGGDWNRPGEVRLWNIATWKERQALKHSGEVLCLAISRDGRRLAAGSWDRTVRVWELK